MRAAEVAVLQEPDEHDRPLRHHPLLPQRLPQPAPGHPDHWKGGKDHQARQDHENTQDLQGQPLILL